MALKTITDIAEVRAGDVAYLHHLCGGYEVVNVDSRTYGQRRLLVNIPHDFPIDAQKANTWLWADGFDHATREIPDKKLPAVKVGVPQAFFTQSGRIVYYSGGADWSYPWCHWGRVGMSLADSTHDFLDSLPASEFPLLNAVPGEVAE